MADKISEKILFLENIKNIKIKKDKSYIVDYENMPYHIPNNGEFKEQYSWVSEYVKNNPEKVEEYIEVKPVYTKEELAEQVRIERNIKLEEADKLLIKYAEEVEIGVIEANDTYRKALLKYKYDLRQIPEQDGFPENVVFPQLPQCN